MGSCRRSGSSKQQEMSDLDSADNFSPGHGFNIDEPSSMEDQITNILNEFFSNNSSSFMDNMLSQFAEEPMDVEDILNLADTPEYMSQPHPSEPPPPPPPLPLPQQQQRPQQQQKLQQNNHHDQLSDLFLTSSTVLPQVTQKNPILVPSETRTSSVPSQTLPASTSPLLTSTQNACESNVTSSSMPQRVIAPVHTIAPSQSAALLHPAGIVPLAQQHNQKASLTFSAIHTSVPNQQQINLQTAPATVAPLQNSNIQSHLQPLNNRQQGIKRSSVSNQLLTLQSMRQPPTDNVRPVFVEAQLNKSDLQLNPAPVMYTTAPVADVMTLSGTPVPAPASIHTLVNTAHGAILVTGIPLGLGADKLPINRITTVAPPPREPKVKKCKIDVEHRYRASINDKFVELKNMVVGIDVKLNKSAILQKAIDCIRDHRNSDAKLQKEIFMLKMAPQKPLKDLLAGPVSMVIDDRTGPIIPPHSKSSPSVSSSPLEVSLPSLEDPYSAEQTLASSKSDGADLKFGRQTGKGGLHGTLIGITVDYILFMRGLHKNAEFNLALNVDGLGFFDNLVFKDRLKEQNV